MNLSQNLVVAINVAASVAEGRRHEFFGLEHLLYALTHDDKTVALIKQCGGDPERLKQRLDRYLEQEVEAMPATMDAEPRPTVALQRVMARAAHHVASSAREEVEGLQYFISSVLQKNALSIFLALSFSTSHGLRVASGSRVARTSHDRWRRVWGFHEHSTGSSQGKKPCRTIPSY